MVLIVLVLPFQALAGAGPRDKGWNEIVPGSNSMTAEQAAATMGKIFAIWTLKDCKIRPDVNHKLLNADIRAGGNEPNDFEKDGKYFEMVRTEAFFQRDLHVELEKLFGKMGDPCEIFSPMPYFIKK